MNSNAGFFSAFTASRCRFDSHASFQRIPSPEYGDADFSPLNMNCSNLRRALRQRKRYAPAALVIPLLLILLSGIRVARASFTIASGGKPRCVIIQEAVATKPEIEAVQELAQTLGQIIGGTLDIQTNSDNVPEHADHRRPRAGGNAVFPDVDLSKFGPEEFVMRVANGRLLLAGGRPRGTVYAVDRFLQDQCGVRWWTSWATNVPHRADLARGEPGCAKQAGL